MKCPVCDVALKMSERQGIEIDYCPECRGVWLDRGELDKIIERTQTYEQVEPPAKPKAQPQSDSYFTEEADRIPKSKQHDEYEKDQRYDDRNRDDNKRYDKHNRPKKRKSVLSEIFEIFE